MKKGTYIKERMLHIHKYSYILFTTLTAGQDKSPEVLKVTKMELELDLETN